MNGHSYKGYEINRVLGKEEFWWISKNGRDLFFGIESLNKAKGLVDGMVLLSMVPAKGR